MMTVRVFGIGRRVAVAVNQQYHAVRDHVRQRMKSIGHQRGRLGEEANHQLRGGQHQVDADADQRAAVPGALAFRAGRGANGHGAQVTRMPGWAPVWGSRMYRPASTFGSAWLAAKTMPSETPKRILRGARLATSTVSLPTRSSGL